MVRESWKFSGLEYSVFPDLPTTFHPQLSNHSWMASLPSVEWAEAKKQCNAQKNDSIAHLLNGYNALIL
jgi:hypothetical protein